MEIGHDELKRLRNAAKFRCQAAHRLLERLDFLHRWGRYGKPELVGALSLGLVVRPDIDFEVYADKAEVSHGFCVYREIASLPGVRQVLFVDHRDSPDADSGGAARVLDPPLYQELYWQVRVLEEDVEWKIDCWHLEHSHPHAHWGRRFSDAMDHALTRETRDAILRIKETARDDGDVHGIHIYRAVLQAGVRTPAEFERWRHRYGLSAALNFWLPNPSS